MLVDINLLQEKDTRKNHLSIIIACMIGITTILISGLLIFFGNLELNRTETLSTELNNLQKLQAKVEENNQIDGRLNTYTHVQDTVTWLNRQKVSAVYLLEELTKKLPQTGYIIAFDFNDHVINMTTQFSDASQAAYYLAYLQQTEWVDQAMLYSLNALDVDSYEAIYQLNLSHKTWTMYDDERGDDQ